MNRDRERRRRERRAQLDGGDPWQQRAMEAARQRMDLAITPLPDIAGKRFFFYGSFVAWPLYYKKSPKDLVESRGGRIVDNLDSSVNYAVLTGRRRKAIEKRQKKVEELNDGGAKIVILGEGSLRNLLRIDFHKTSFHFSGDLSINEGSPERAASIVKKYGSIIHNKPSEETDFIVLGKKAEAEVKDLSGPCVLESEDFIDLLYYSLPSPGNRAGFPWFVHQLETRFGLEPIQKAKALLHHNNYKLRFEYGDSWARGVLRRGSRDHPWAFVALKEDGSHLCFRDDPYAAHELCRQQPERACPHILAFALALVCAHQVPATAMVEWLDRRQEKSMSWWEEGGWLEKLTEKNQKSDEDWPPLDLFL